LTGVNGGPLRVAQFDSVSGASWPFSPHIHIDESTFVKTSAFAKAMADKAADKQDEQDKTLFRVFQGSLREL